jgi:hypothetical protein
LAAVGCGLRLSVWACRTLPTASVQACFGFLQFISLDSCPHCAQGDVVRCEAPLAALSLALPDPSQHDRFPSLRRVYITTLRYGACHCARVTEIRASSAIKFEDEGWPRPYDSVWTLAHRCCSRIRVPYGPPHCRSRCSNGGGKNRAMKNSEIVRGVTMWMGTVDRR